MTPGEILGRLRALCLSLPGAKETTTSGNPAFRAHRKSFCVWECHHGEWCIVVRVGLEHQPLFLSDDRFWKTPYIGHRGWVSLRAGTEWTWEELEGLVRSSHAMTRPLRAAKRRVLSLLMLAGSLAPLAAQPAIEDPLLRWMDHIAQGQLAKRSEVIAQVQSVAEARQRQARVREQILELIGGLPENAAPLNARVISQVGNPSYTLEKVIFESLPKFYVTANLYRPNEPGRYPAVLLSAGHTMLGKTENHRIAANLAAKGFVALAYDPVGLGERMQVYDRRIGKSIAGCCTNEHLHAGAQSLLIGQGVARYFIHDAMRALDYLESRPDVDATRMGAAGCSGGGSLTTYIAALDPRIRAAAPACFLNSFQVLFSGPFPDSEMSLAGFLAAGLDHADFLEMVAPKPWLILATEFDFFTPAATRLIYDEARQWYRLFDAEDRVRYFVGPGPHGTPRETREQIYGWMIRWLKDGKGDAREQEIPLYRDDELQVTGTGQVDDGAGSLKLHEVIRAEYHARRTPQGIEPLLAELRRLQIPSGRSVPKVRILEEVRGPARTLEGTPTTPFDRRRIALESEPGVEILGTLYLPRISGRKRALVLVKERYSLALAEMAVDKGIVVLEIEPRDSPAENDNRPFLGNWLTNSRAASIGRNLPAMRAHDLLRAVDYLGSRDDVDPQAIRGAGRELKGVWLLLAAAVDPRLGKIWVDRTPHSLASALDKPLVNNLFDATIPGFLLHWDFADLVQAIGAGRVIWTDPANWTGQTVQIKGPYRYRLAGQTDDRFLAELFTPIQ